MEAIRYWGWPPRLKDGAARAAAERGVATRCDALQWRLPRNFTPMPVTAPAAGLDLPHARLPRHRALEVLCMTDARAKADAARALFEAVVAAEAAWGGASAMRIRHSRPLPAWPCRAGPRAGTGAAPEGGAPPLAAHPGGAGGDDPRAVPHRVQRDQPRARRRLALRRHAAGATTATGCRWPREAPHFTLLASIISPRLGAEYGDFPGHNSLWEMCDKTAGDVLARMALVPRTLEARGLDASPLVRAKLAEAGDDAAARGHPRHHPAR